MTLQEFKEKLGDDAIGLTDEQILKTKIKMEEMANIFFDMWLEDIKNKKE